MPKDILLIAHEREAAEAADELRKTLDRGVEIAETRRAGLAVLRRREFALVIIEESLAAADASQTELLYAAADGAPVLELPLLLHGTLRVVRQARGALHRRSQDQARARVAAAQKLQGELNSSLTGLLLQSELLLRDAPPSMTPKLQHVVELAGELRERLRMAG